MVTGVVTGEVLCSNCRSAGVLVHVLLGPAQGGPGCLTDKGAQLGLAGEGL